MPRHPGVSVPPAAYAVRFGSLGREATCRAGETLFQCARRAGIRIVGACGGRGVCGTCLVRVDSGQVGPLSPRHAGTPPPAQADGWLRSCLVQPLGDCSLELSPRSLAPVVRAEVEGLDSAPLALDLAAHAREAALSLPRDAPLLGLAIDLGTTNVAGFLVDLRTGARLASLGIENPQAAYGADLVSRLNHAIRAPQGAAELQSAALAAIAALARDLCDAVGRRPEEIADVGICGNTAMHHLLLRLPVAQLARAPFVPATAAAIDLDTRELGFSAAPGAYAHLMPGIGGFVGGDHVAALLATEARWSGSTALILDIGTNTEVSLVHQGEITTVSCPSGPALEGGHISCGMRAAEGAIERVRLQDGKLAIQTIEGAAPVGLCGSGVLDCIAAMLQAGIIDRRGRIQPGHPAVRVNGSHRDVMLAPGVAIEQADVRAVQLAKAAIRTGIDLLLAGRGIGHQGLERVLIAGAFGAYLDLGSAIAIGLLPPVPRARILQVGNAAGTGVRMALASAAARERARRLAARCRHIELGSLAEFRKTFMRRIGFD